LLPALVERAGRTKKLAADRRPLTAMVLKKISRSQPLAGAVFFFRQVEVGMQIVGRLAGGLVRRCLVVVGVACMTPLMMVSNADAADHVVPASTPKFDCSKVGPGDTVTLPSGVRGNLTIENCTGASGKPIVIRNDSRGTSPTQIRRSSGSGGGFVLYCFNCIWTTIDGSSKWVGAPAGKTYGIKVSMTGGGSPTALVKIGGVSRFVTIRNVEVDGGWPSVATDGIGISINDQVATTSKYPNLWREGILIEDNYVHNTEGEGMYIGPNWGTGGLPLRNIEIANNRVETTGWDGIQLKSAISGTNIIHHNTVKRAGAKKDSSAGAHYGISLYEGNGLIYSNWVEKSGESGISHYIHYMPSSYPAQKAEIYNNVVVDPGQTGPNAGHGIVSTRSAGKAKVLPNIYNNTVIRAKDDGIRVGGDAAVGGFVRDNIVAESRRLNIRAPSNVSQINNRVGSVSQMGFVNASSMNFKLAPASSARNAGSSTSSPYDDYAGVKRPQENARDQGAYEFAVAQ
jgi:hypothetical protein